MTNSYSESMDAQELLNRRRARTQFLAYIEYLDLGFIPAEHHRLLISYLQRIADGELSKLMILMPPGSAKSTYTSILFPPFFMGCNPGCSVLGVSNTTELAERFSRRSRAIVNSTAWGMLYGGGVSEDSGAAGNWETTTGCEFFAAGVGSAIAGRRADLGLIDDPIKTREEADSEHVREKQWDWYVSDFLTRLKPRARQVFVETHWHENDLGGRILERERDQWTVLCLPMEAQAGDPLGRKPGARLWPDWFTAEMVETAKRDTRAWNALYQQDPAPESGDFFTRDMFGAYAAGVEQNLHIYGFSDYAVTDGGGDFTEHGIFGMDWNGDLHVLDWWYGQTSADVWIEKQIDLIARHKPLCWWGEAGPIRKAIEPFLKKRMQERRIMCRLEWLPSIADKISRARAISARASMGKVFLPANNPPWLSHVLGQLMRFPGGKHDDAVDVFSLAGRALENVTTPRIPKRQPLDGNITLGRDGWMR